MILCIKHASICVFCPHTAAFGSNNGRVLLRDLSVLTLYNGRQTQGRRSSPIPQLKCVGGTAGCSSFVPQVVQCNNRGFDGYDVQVRSLQYCLYIIYTIVDF